MSSSRLCSNCKAVVPEEHFYCGRCGASFGEEGAAGADETLFFGAMQAPGRAKLILISGEGLEGLSYHLNSTEHIAGRETGVILFTDDEYLDDEHATFFYQSNKLYLRDEDSLNGTFVKIREPRTLDDGDEFLVGRERFRVEYLDVNGQYSMDNNTLMYVSPSEEFRFRLVHVVEGLKPGDAYCNEANSMTIGREGTDILFADDRHVSPEHARVQWKNDAVVLTDLDSKNGTFVRIKDPEPLQHGDYVFLGSELVRIEINI